jgi:hypothetical protein
VISPLRRAFALGPPVRLWASLMLLFMAALPASAAGQEPGTWQQIAAPLAQPQMGQPVSFCYAWDFTNDTGVDADDLHVRLQGVHAVTEVYAGADNPFGAPTAASGYDSALDAYHLEFTGATVAPGERVRLGVCTVTPYLLLGMKPAAPLPFYWSVQGSVQQPAPLFVGLSMSSSAGGGVRLGVHNSHATPLVLWSLDLLATGQPFTLEDLNGTSLSGLPVGAMLVADPITIPAGGVQYFDIPPAGSLAAGGTWLTEMTVTTEDDLANEAHIYTEALPPPVVVYLPLIFK